MTLPDDEKAQAALARIDAPDNDERDRLIEADAAVLALSRLPAAEVEKFALAELMRFKEWLTGRRRN